MPGGTNRSYGIQVGRLAGLPRDVIERAKELLKSLEEAKSHQSSPPKAPTQSPPSELSHFQMSLFGGPPEPSPVLEALDDIHPDTLSPLEAIQTLYALKKLRDKDEKKNTN